VLPKCPLYAETGRNKCFIFYIALDVLCCSGGGASKILGEQKAWAGTGKGVAAVLPPASVGVAPWKIFDKNPAFWFFVGKKMCS